jgi:hypothetical protein
MAVITVTDINLGHKWCPECDRFHPVAKFYKAGKTKDGLSKLCKTCFNKKYFQKKEGGKNTESTNSHRCFLEDALL